MAGTTVVGIGELLWDVFPGGQRMGGAPANVVSMVRGLGGDAALISAVGEDAPGRGLLEGLRARGLSTSTVTTNPDHPTGRAVVDCDPVAGNRFTIAGDVAEDVAWDYLEPTAAARACVRRADAVVFGTLGLRAPRSREAVGALVRSASRGVARVCDLGLRPPFFTAETVRNALEMATVAKLASDELPVVGRLLGFSVGDERAALELLVETFDLDLIALTRGARGSVVLARDGTRSEEFGAEVEVVDTVGAWAAFVAGLALGSAMGQPPPLIVEHASALARFVCSRAGATPAVPPEIASRFARRARPVLR